MVKIIKRIIVGVGIALVISMIKGNFGFITNVNAKEYRSFVLAKEGTITSDYVTLYTGSGNFANMGDGTLFYTLAVYTKSTSVNLPSLSTAYVDSGGINYTCQIGNTSVVKSASTEQEVGFTYTIMCPMKAAANGVTSIGLIFGHSLNQGYSYHYRTSYACNFVTDDVTDIITNFGYTQQVIRSESTNIINAIDDALEDNQQAVTSAIEQQTQATQDVNDTLNDDSVDNEKAEDDISDMQDKIASNSAITQLLTLPITLYQAILNNVNGTCSPFNLGTLYNHQLTLPCINLQNYLGSSIWTAIDVICSGIFILSFRKKMVDIFNHMTSLKDGGNELE